MAANRKVNLFVVGAMRAGTTSFIEVLEKHPDIYISPIKEPHFFVDDLPKEVYSPEKQFVAAKYFKNDFPKKIHIAHIKAAADYEQLFSGAGSQKYRVDASTCYLHEPNAAEKIKKYNPDAKIIIVLRDPLERAYSHHTMNIGLGRENKSFEIVMKQELKDAQEHNFSWHSILNMSCYDTSIDRYQCLFNDVSVLFMEDFSGAPRETFGRLEKFLQIAPFRGESFPQRNKSFHIKNTELLYTLKKTKLKQIVSNMLGFDTKQKILNALSHKHRKPLVSRVLKLQLNKEFIEQSKMYFKRN